MRLHGGRTICASKALPEAEMIVPTLEITAKNDLKGKRVAIIDDSEDLRHLLREVLEDEGYEVILWHPEQGTKEAIIRESPDALIIDIMLEGTDNGWRLLQSLKLDAETRHIPIIVCTADAVFIRKHRERLNELGCYTVAKPFDLEYLVAQINAAVSAN